MLNLREIQKHFCSQLQVPSIKLVKSHKSTRDSWKANMTYGSRITEINPLSPCSNLSHSFWIILYIVCICSLRIVHSHEPKRIKVAAANEKKSQIKRIELVAECHFDWYVNVCWLQWKQNARIARIMKIRQQKPKQLIKTVQRTSTKTLQVNEVRCPND